VKLTPWGILKKKHSIEIHYYYSNKLIWQTKKRSRGVEWKDPITESVNAPRILKTPHV